MREYKSVSDRVAKERHSRPASVLLVAIGLDRARSGVLARSQQNSAVQAEHRYARPPPLIRPAWKLSRLWRASMCLTELNRAYDRPLKGLDTTKTYRFHGNSKPAFSVRCDFMRPDVAC